jgi:hypothetical protein
VKAGIALLQATALALPGLMRAQQPRPEGPALSTNQRLIEDLRTGEPDLERLESVFGYVFAQLPGSVRVLPTENYYYFRFASGGREIWGNLRLDAVDRDAGLLDFGYFSAWNRPERPEDLSAGARHKQLSRTDGVDVVRVAALLYDVSYRGKTVRFALNEVSQALPAGQGFLDQEEFLGRNVDESGFTFVLLFDRRARAFRFVLDESAPPPDTLRQLEPGVLVGQLSGFAFYEDRARRRKVLFGVDADNMRRNNYYDGPFDQLADNFVPASLRERMEEAYPYARGRLDFRGVFCNPDGSRGSSRLALTPFVTYNTVKELRGFVAVSRSRCGADEACLLAALTRDYKQDVPAAGVSDGEVFPKAD